ncbi:hypothetical protein TNCV_4727781 [Trichonephila clavipes]|nr:hypothetical protein TNCV_4727781 [Trichonephila clavipes]
MGHSVSKIVKQQGLSRSTMARCVVRDGFRCIVRSQRVQTLAQITTQWNEDASRTVRNRIVQRSLHLMGFRSIRPMRVPLVNGRYGAARLSRFLDKTSQIMECRGPNTSSME